MKISLQMTAIAATLAFASVSAFAQPVSTIDLTITGNTEVTATDILFNTIYTGAGTYAAPGTQGQFQVNKPIADIFATNGVTPGETGGITSLSSTTTGVGVPIIPPLKFITFDGPGGTNLNLYLTELGQGSFAPGSPFYFTQTASGAVADFNVMGYVLNTTDNSMTSYTGTFSATFNGTSVANLTNPADLPQYTGFSATFSVTTIPEPASLILVGAGLLGAGLIARRKRKA